MVNYQNECGGLEAPDRVFKYVVADGVDRVTFTTDNDNTDYPVIPTCET